jgi:hypothetical protein
MTSFLHWRMITWLLVLWSAYIATWMLVTGSGPTVAVVWWLAGVVGLALLRPAYRMAPTGREPASPPAPGDAETNSSGR